MRYRKCNFALRKVHYFFIFYFKLLGETSARARHLPTDRLRMDTRLACKEANNK